MAAGAARSSGGAWGRLAVVSETRSRLQVLGAEDGDPDAIGGDR